MEKKLKTPVRYLGKKQFYHNFKLQWFKPTSLKLLNFADNLHQHAYIPIPNHVN